MIREGYGKSPLLFLPSWMHDAEVNITPRIRKDVALVLASYYAITIATSEHKE